MCNPHTIARVHKMSHDCTPQKTDASNKLMCTPSRAYLSRYFAFVLPIPRRHIVNAASNFLTNAPDEDWITNATISPRTLDAMLLRGLLRESMAEIFNTIYLLVGPKNVLPEDWDGAGVHAFPAQINCWNNLPHKLFQHHRQKHMHAHIHTLALIARHRR
jgi:hypothetical protein